MNNIFWLIYKKKFDFVYLQIVTTFDVNFDDFLSRLYLKERTVAILLDFIIFLKSMLNNYLNRTVPFNINGRLLAALKNLCSHLRTLEFTL